MRHQQRSHVSVVKEVCANFQSEKIENFSTNIFYIHLYSIDNFYLVKTR